MLRRVRRVRRAVQRGRAGYQQVVLCRYFAKLLTWASGKEVTEQMARDCFVHEKNGCKWRVDWVRVHELGVYPYKWPLPLSQESLRAADAEGAMQLDKIPMPQKPKRKPAALQETGEEKRPAVAKAGVKAGVAKPLTVPATRKAPVRVRRMAVGGVFVRVNGHLMSVATIEDAKLLADAEDFVGDRRTELYAASA